MSPSDIDMLNLKTLNSCMSLCYVALSFVDLYGKCKYNPMQEFPYIFANLSNCRSRLLHRKRIWSYFINLYIPGSPPTSATPHFPSKCPYSFASIQRNLVMAIEDVKPEPSCPEGAAKTNNFTTS